MLVTDLVHWKNVMGLNLLPTIYEMEMENINTVVSMQTRRKSWKLRHRAHCCDRAFS